MAITLQPTRVLSRRDWAPGLFSLVLDEQVPMKAGQFVTVGLAPQGDRHTRRAYSVASAPGQPLELLVVEVEDGRVSPMLAHAKPGDTLFVSDRGKGLFTLDDLPRRRDLWLIATGTGLAPYLSMLREGAIFEAAEHIVLAYGVRQPEHLAYLDELRALQAAHNLTVVPLCSRTEPPEGGLRGRVTERLIDGTLEHTAGVRIAAETSHVLLCGNPTMIDEMVGLLMARGLQRHSRRVPGHITTERYW